MGGSPAEIEARLNQGEWLLPGEVATLLGVDRRTVDRLLRAGRMGWRNRPGLGLRPYRECDPADVRRELEARRRVHRGDGTP